MAQAPPKKRKQGIRMRRLLKNLTCSMNLTLEGLPPYDFGLTIHKPGGWPLLTPFEVFEQGTLWTVMRQASGEVFGLKLRSAGTVEKPKISCKVYSHEEFRDSEKRELTETITWILNLGEDIRGFYALAKSDPLVKVLVKDLYGMRNTKQPDIFSRLILAVTLQMAPITRSDQMMNLLIKEYGERVRFDGKEISYWPSAETIANATVAELEQKCKLGYRAKSLKSIAESIYVGFPSLRELEELSAQEAKAKLMELKGIGEYSAEIVSPHPGFALDVWSARIFSLLILGREAESPRDLIPKLKKIAADRWGQWRGSVFVYVLHDLENLSRRFNLNLTQV
jgi:3-methyladenine DNA glycosylase/8-oxoguanine DNA glycosylase